MTLACIVRSCLRPQVRSPPRVGRVQGPQTRQGERAVPQRSHCVRLALRECALTADHDMTTAAPGHTGRVRNTGCHEGGPRRVAAGAETGASWRGRRAMCWWRRALFSWATAALLTHAHFACSTGGAVLHVHPVTQHHGV